MGLHEISQESSTTTQQRRTLDVECDKLRDQPAEVNKVNKNHNQLWHPHTSYMELTGSGSKGNEMFPYDTVSKSKDAAALTYILQNKQMHHSFLTKTISTCLQYACESRQLWIYYEQTVKLLIIITNFSIKTTVIILTAQQSNFAKAQQLLLASMSVVNPQPSSYRHLKAAEELSMPISEPFFLYSCALKHFKNTSPIFWVQRFPHEFSEFMVYWISDKTMTYKKFTQYTLWYTILPGVMVLWVLLYMMPI